MDSKNILKPEYLNDLLYILSGSLANAWLTSSFPIWSKKIIFLDNYLLEGSNFIYIILYFSFSFVLGAFLRESGELLYKFLYKISLYKFLFIKIKLQRMETYLRIPARSPNYDNEYLYFRSVARLNAHFIFLAFFVSCLILSMIYDQSLFYKIALFMLIINSVRCINNSIKAVFKS